MDVQPRDRWALRFLQAIPELATVIGGEEGFRRALDLRRDQQMRWRNKIVHLECYGEVADAATVVFHHGFGAYSALYAPFLAALASRGTSVVAIDRPGHGLSEGRRGDCTVEELADVTRLAVQSAVPATSDPVVLFGSSSGGMLTSCLIPYLEDLVDGYICHGVHNPAYVRPLIGRPLARAADLLPAVRFPYRLIPRRIRNGISTIPAVRDWFRPGSDDLATFDQTLRSVLSMTLGYRPPHSPSDVDRPVLAVTGEGDQMLPVRQVREAVERLDLRHVEVQLISGQHMLLHERPIAVLEAVTDWIGRLP